MFRRRACNNLIDYIQSRCEIAPSALQSFCLSQRVFSARDGHPQAKHFFSHRGQEGSIEYMHILSHTRRCYRCY